MDRLSARGQRLELRLRPAPMVARGQRAAALCPARGVRPGDDRPGEKIRHTPRRLPLQFTDGHPESDDGLFRTATCCSYSTGIRRPRYPITKYGCGFRAVTARSSRPTSAVSAARSGPTCGGSISPTPCRGTSCPASASTTPRARRRFSSAKSEGDDQPPAPGGRQTTVSCSSVLPGNPGFGSRRSLSGDENIKKTTTRRCRAGFRTTNSIQ